MQNLHFHFIVGFFNFSASHHQPIMLTLQEREGIVVEALDCFCRAPSKETDRILLAEVVGRLWNVQERSVVQVLKSNQPSLTIEDDDREFQNTNNLGECS